MSTLRKGIILGILLSMCHIAHAQNLTNTNVDTSRLKVFHLGNSIGFNLMDCSSIPNTGYAIKHQMFPGINLNMIFDFRLSGFLHFRILPGIQTGQKKISITDKLNDTIQTLDIESFYLELPVLLKYRLNHAKEKGPYIVAGICPRFDLTGSDLTWFRPSRRLLRSFDLYPELGIGMGFQKPKIKLAAELKFSAGILDIFYPQPDPYYNIYRTGLKKVYSRMVILSVQLEYSR